MDKNWILLYTFLLLAGISNGQSSKKKDKKKNRSEKVTPRFEQKGNSYAPFNPDETKKAVAPTKAKKSKKKKSKSKSAYDNFSLTMDQKVVEFKERMETNAKENRKRLRKMDKPQYSDPSYFGHKRKPKIRKVKNRKFCKECGITH